MPQCPILAIFVLMRPDYPSKAFLDERMSYFMLMEALAMDAG
jgi:hypothetical protein